jgi:hypothetical protein
MYYKDILNYKITKKLEIFEEKKEIKNIINNNKINELILNRKRIKYYMLCKYYIYL